MTHGADLRKRSKPAPTRASNQPHSPFDETAVTNGLTCINTAVPPFINEGRKSPDGEAPPAYAGVPFLLGLHAAEVPVSKPQVGSEIPIRSASVIMVTFSHPRPPAKNG
jgi:hypothetical protein